MSARPTAGGPGPDVSVVVPTRNREALVHRLLRQLVALEGDLTYEIIVIDEASTDGTPELLGAMAAEHGIRVVRHEVPVGLPAARNVGTEAATAPYIGWIDDDDLTSPDRFDRQHAALRETGRRWSVAAKVDIDDELAILGHRPCPPPGDLLAGILAFNILPTAAQGLLVERDLVMEVGGFDPTLDSAEDWDFAIRLLARAEPHLLDEPLVGYRTGVASMSTDTRRMERAIATMLAKHEQLRATNEVEPDWVAIHRSLLAADLLHSRRMAARRAALILRRQPSARNLAQLVLAAASPARMAERSAKRRREQVPDSWQALARRWLDALPPAGAT